MGNAPYQRSCEDDMVGVRWNMPLVPQDLVFAGPSQYMLKVRKVVCVDPGAANGNTRKYLAVAKGNKSESNKPRIQFGNKLCASGALDFCKRSSSSTTGTAFSCRLAGIRRVGYGKLSNDRAIFLEWALTFSSAKFG